MEPEDPLNGRDFADEELDARLSALFRSCEPNDPSAGFASRTMKAVRRQALPPGRRRLRTPLAMLTGWAALIAGVSISAWMLALNQPMLASAFTILVSGGIGIGVTLVQFAGSNLALSDALATTGRAVLRAVATTEGSTGLVLIAVVGAVSLSMLRHLLMPEGTERGVSQWQEL